MTDLAKLLWGVIFFAAQALVSAVLLGLFARALYEALLYGWGLL